LRGGCGDLHKLLHQYLPGRTEEDHETPQAGQRICCPKFETALLLWLSAHLAIGDQIKGTTEWVYLA